MKLPPHDRYRFKPFFGSSHSWALKQLVRLNPEAEILDIGAGSGAIGRTLQTKDFSQLFAVEIDKTAREHIAPFYRNTVESLADLVNKQFDVVILLDVIEHLADPFEFYKKAMAFLKPGGLALISVPNVAHWSVRLPLLFGRFDYNECGILDSTHLHFFTKRRFQQLLATAAEMEPQQYAVSIVPLELLLPEALWRNLLFRTFSKVRLALATLFPGLLAYQHLALLKKRTTE